ncbi:AsmA-like C-terminal region-containing protein [Candidatus Pelagibacter communis]|uniref:AsmA-like C-terminal region-containing protein n=1 Tax=Pelagibacter ubique TaxID=198252 RepID=UPI00094D0967|nr:AsmA-like C-terminal region-containing protein [Candidatus Pelagibacter ubique]
MKKIIYRSVIFLISVSFFLLIYLSTIGIKTNKFNSQIISQIKKIEPKIKLKLNDVSVKLNLIKFTIDAKTVGTSIILKDKIIKLENIKSQISLNSIINNEFALSEISASTNSLPIKDMIGFIRALNRDPKLFIAEKFIKNGYIVTNLNFKFDEFGKLKDNYKIDGLINDGQISMLNKNLNKLNSGFQFSNNKFQFFDMNLLLNNKKILIPYLIVTKKNNGFLVSGKSNTKDIELNNNDIKNLINYEFLNKNFQKIRLSSDFDFNFKVNRKFKFYDILIKSNLDVDYLKLKNSIDLKDIFPNIKKEFILENHKIELVYNKKNLNIVGSGNVSFQDKEDSLEYEFKRQKDKIFFDTNLKISNNPFIIDFLNYEKTKGSILDLSLKGSFKDNEILYNQILITENKNKLFFKDLNFSKGYKINDLDLIEIDFTDKENIKNKLQIKKDKKRYTVTGESLNINKLINDLLESKKDNKRKYLNKDFKFIFDIKKIHLDKINKGYDLTGSLLLNNNEIIDLNLVSKFSSGQNINLTIKSNDNLEKITTLFSNEAKPLVDRYKFIKGFKEGKLDFYSIEKNNKSQSTLRIYDFKLKELPALTKLLTLASLQGIADLLSGEGIRFNEFEMNFENKGNLMTINEIYAIGPAISVLMEGYIEKDNLISLRGTLVPATTINKTISSIPLLGDILVGKKTGEGVFGVSFKIKGPPKNLETTVNPIKTLTPRFITRTLEKFKRD